MATSIPSLPSATALLDTLSLTTWYKVQAKATDNILNDNVVSAALRAKGCYKPQHGGRHIERTVRYGTKTAYNVGPGSVLPTGEDEYGTQAIWNWARVACHAQRSIFKDNENSGEGRRVEWVQYQLEMMRDAMATAHEDSLVAAVDSDGGTDLRADLAPQSLFNIFPGKTTYGMAGDYYDNATAGTYLYGGIDTGSGLNTWWRPNYAVTVTPILSNLKTEWRHMMNTCSHGSSDAPDLIIVNQEYFEAACELFESAVTITSPMGKTLLDFGFKTLNYMGAEVLMCMHSDWPTYGQMFLNSRWVDIVYDPALWMYMIPWQWVSSAQLERITRVVSQCTGPICYNLRRQGYLGKSS